MGVANIRTGWQMGLQVYICTGPARPPGQNTLHRTGGSHRHTERDTQIELPVLGVRNGAALQKRRELRRRPVGCEGGTDGAAGVDGGADRCAQFVMAVRAGWRRLTKDSAGVVGAVVCGCAHVMWHVVWVWVWVYT